jgi:hypothetical protein
VQHIVIVVEAKDILNLTDFIEIKMLLEQKDLQVKKIYQPKTNDDYNTKLSEIAWR